MLFVVYGNVIESDRALALPPAPPGRLPDVRLERATSVAFDAARAGIGPPPPGDWIQHRVLDDGGFFMRWEDWLELLVSADGKNVSYRPLRADAPDGIEAYIANFAVSASLIQRGEEPLHATVVEVEGRAIGLLGRSGAGKSTLAAFLTSRGARLVTDDMLRVIFDNDTAWAQPGPRRLKLLEDSAARLSSWPNRGRWNPLASKYLFDVGEPTKPQTAGRLTALFQLDAPAAGDTLASIASERLKGVELFKAISAATMNSRIMTAQRLARQLRFAERLARMLPVYRLTYNRSYDRLGELESVLLRLSNA